MSERKLGQIGFWKKGEPAVWASASCLTVILLITLTLIYVIIVNGLGVFWPHQLVTADLKDGTKVTGEILDREKVPNSSSYRLRFKTGNRDLYELDFRWVLEDEMTERTVERDIVALERLEYGNFFGFVQSVTDADGETVTGEGAFDALLAAEKALNPMRHQLEKLGKKINGLNYKTEKANKTIQKKLYKGATETDPDIVAQQEVLKTIKADFDRVVADYERIEHEMEAYKVVMIDSNGEEKEMHVAHLVRIYQPNRMSLGAKIGFYGMKVKELLTEEPREANTEGGLMPAIFGTVMLVFVMSIFCFPFGVIAGIYLREYAKDGWLLKTVRIAVNNLAGVPSIVYGVFGLGFFIYGIGETIDHVFYPEMLPTPTAGAEGRGG
ncbi:MAG: phosphate ABC transporter, permease protein PstA, partial [Verrucomicrobiota bacterium]